MIFICANCRVIATDENEAFIESGTVLVCDSCDEMTTVLLCGTEEYSVAVEAIKKDKEQLRIKLLKQKQDKPTPHTW